MLRIELSIASALLGLAIQADYMAQLYFANLTRGTSNAGALYVEPGDQVAIKFSFHDTAGTSSWLTFRT